MHMLIDGDLLFESVWIGGSGYYMHGRDQYVHRTIAERALGRKLKRDEYVYHIDYDKTNNSRTNLVICHATFHKYLHQRTDCLNAGFDPNTHLKCTRCKTWHHRDLFAKCKSSATGYGPSCRESLNKWRKENGHNKDKFDERAKLLQQLRRAKKKAALNENAN